MADELKDAIESINWLITTNKGDYVKTWNAIMDIVKEVAEDDLLDWARDIMCPECEWSDPEPNIDESRY